MPEYHYEHIRSLPLSNLCFDEGDADKENKIQFSEEESVSKVEKGVSQG